MGIDLGLDGALDEGPESGNRDHEQPQRRIVARRRVPHLRRRRRRGRRHLEEEHGVMEEREADRRREPGSLHRPEPWTGSTGFEPVGEGGERWRMEERLGRCHY